MKKESYFKIFVLLLSFVFILSACGGGATPAVIEEAVEEVAEQAEEVIEEVVEEVEEVMAEKVEIEIWQNQNDFTVCMEENVIDVFNAQSDTISIKSVTFESAWDSARTAIAGGEGPDIVRSPGPSFVFEMVQAGQLLSLEEFSNVYGWSDSVAEFALNLGQVDGELYSLPDEMETLVVYYNKTVFDTNGWEVPTTVDELHALAAEIDAAGIIPFTHANAEWRPANEWHVGNYLNHVAGPDKVHAALTGEIEWTDPDFIKAIELLDEAQQNGWYMGGLEFYYTTTFDDLHTALGTGEGAMNIEGTWAASGINDTWFSDDTGGNEWGWFPMPSSNGDTIFDLGMGNTSSINGNTEHPQEAAEYLNYYFSADVQATAFTECGKAPAPVVIPEGTITGVDSRIADIFESMSNAVASGGYGYTTWTFFPPKTDVYIYEEIEKVWSGDITAEEYMIGLNDQFQEEFAAGEIPPIPAR
ncbi:MAG: raffinose/stachyose/melibiose transport system substrate-binding protein [Cellvibrionaceae bacterium]|jgi:raffinose/stachyose/melibiose transport system substrate-binding protein